MRDSLEDYEYLYLLGGGQPEVNVTNLADTQADKIIASTTGYTRHSEFMYNLRRLIGLKNGGEIDTIPDIEPPPTHPRAEGDPGDYYINFQDPNGEPSADPLVVDGKTYLKIGSSDYNQTAGYGWYAPNDAYWETEWLTSGPNVLQRSILYSDYGRPATFEFDLPNGEYDVTVSVGWEGRTYGPQQIDIEGVNFVNAEYTTPSNPYLVRTKSVYVADNKLTLSIGIFDEYTILNYLDIEAAYVPPDRVTDLVITEAITSTDTLTATLTWTPLAEAVTTTIHYADTFITDNNWGSTTLLTDSLPGAQDYYQVIIPFSGGPVYFAQKSQDSSGEWSLLSNNAFWPRFLLSLPFIIH
jgi:hypothetical protein